MVALGSSFAARPGIAPIIELAATRSGANYPHLVAHALGASLTDATVSGATTDTIPRTGQRARWTRFPAQIEAVTPGTDLVTVTAGGNDLGDLRAVIMSGVLNRLSHSSVVGSIARWGLRREALRLPGAEQVERVTQGLVQIVEEARRRAPRATVILVDYVPVVSGAAAGFSQAQIAHFTGFAHRLSGEFAAAAERTGAELVPASAYEVGNGVGTAALWIVPLQSGRRLVSSFHPNAAGMHAVADAVLAALGDARQGSGQA